MDLLKYKVAFEDHFKENSEIELIYNQRNDQVLRGIIFVRGHLRKVVFHLYETGDFVVKRPNGKITAYYNKTTKQLIAYLDSIIKNVK